MYWLMALSVIIMPIMALVVVFAYEVGRYHLDSHKGRFAMRPTTGNIITTTVVALISIALCAGLGLLVLHLFAPVGLTAAVYAILWILSAIMSLYIAMNASSA